MAKQKEQTGALPVAGAKVEALAAASGTRRTGHKPGGLWHAGHRRRLPVALIVAFLGVLAAGIILGSTRELRIEATVWKALNDCEATAWTSEDGLSDAYGIVHIRLQRGEVAAYLSLCETNPKLALRIFRESLDKGNLSAKIVALHSAMYLVGRKQLEDSDMQRILGQLTLEGSDAGLRKVAQRVLSDLTTIDDAARPSHYEVVPAGLPPPTHGRDARATSEGEPKPNKVQTREEKLRDSGKTVLHVRWSSPSVAAKWWDEMAAKGHWDNELQRFVIPPAQSEEREVRSEK